MKTGVVINIPEDKIVQVTEVAEWALDMTAAQTMDMAAGAANHLQEDNTETAVQAIGELVAVIGEPVVMKVVVTGVDIPKISIWAGVKADSAAMMMIIIVPAEVTEVKTAELPVLEGKATQDLQAGAAAATAIGN
jgi:hypothetical protein